MSKNQLEPWEVALAEDVKHYEFDFDPSALEGFEALLAAEATVGATAAATTAKATAGGTAGFFTVKTLLSLVLSVALSTAAAFALFSYLNPSATEGPSTPPVEEALPDVPTPDLSRTEPSEIDPIAPFTPAITDEELTIVPAPTDPINTFGGAEETSRPDLSALPADPSASLITSAPAAAPERVARTAVAPLPAATRFTPVEPLSPPAIEIPELREVKVPKAPKRDRSTLFPDVIEKY